eukprot:364496-Chlamydomonas_euryale.AAC.44
MFALGLHGQHALCACAWSVAGSATVPKLCESEGSVENDALAIPTAMLLHVMACAGYVQIKCDKNPRHNQVKMWALSIAGMKCWNCAALTACDPCLWVLEYV